MSCVELPSLVFLKYTLVIYVTIAPKYLLKRSTWKNGPCYTLTDVYKKLRPNFRYLKLYN